MHPIRGCDQPRPQQARTASDRHDPPASRLFPNRASTESSSTNVHSCGSATVGPSPAAEPGRLGKVRRGREDTRRSSAEVAGYLRPLPSSIGSRQAEASGPAPPVPFGSSQADSEAAPCFVPDERCRDARRHVASTGGDESRTRRDDDEPDPGQAAGGERTRFSGTLVPRSSRPSATAHGWIRAPCARLPPGRWFRPLAGCWTREGSQGRGAS